MNIHAVMKLHGLSIATAWLGVRGSIYIDFAE